MAHDFMIQAGSERTYFFGYADGFLYRAEREWNKLGYPDPTRFDDILEFKRLFDAGKLSGPYRIGFY